MGSHSAKTPPGVWGSLDGHLPWETALREPSRLLQTGSRHYFTPRRSLVRSQYRPQM